MYLKTYQTKDHVLIAACDHELLGKTFHQGRFKLEVKSEFYGGALTTMDEALKALGEANIGNIVGNRIVEAAIKKNLIHSEAVVLIAGVSHAQIVKL